MQKNALICGGGVGAPPLLLLAKRLIESGKNAYVALGFNSAADVMLADEFKAVGAQVEIATMDGSAGLKGTVAAALPRQTDCDFFFACGPKAMLKALSASLEIRGEVSLEERMGCGFGACMGCSCKTLTGYKRICKDGPVMKKEEILWEA